MLPNHYYTHIADTRELAKAKRIWANPNPMHGVDMNVTRQLEWLKAAIAPL